MKVIDPGHRYELDHLDGDGHSVLTFVKRIGENFPGNEGPGYEGTITQEVLRALIDRTKYVNRQKPHNRNVHVVEYFRAALFSLEWRAAEIRREDMDFWCRMVGVCKARSIPIEEILTCKKCGHIGCARHD